MRTKDTGKFKPIIDMEFQQIKSMLDPNRDFRIKNIQIKVDKPPINLDYTFINFTNDREGENEFLITMIHFNEIYEIETRWNNKDDEFTQCSLEEIRDVFKRLKITAP